MYTILKQYLSAQIKIENDILASLNYNHKDVMMGKIKYEDLPENIKPHLYSRDAFMRIMNYLEYTHNFIEDPNATNDQKLEDILMQFMDEYSLWLGENHFKFPIAKIIKEISPSNLQTIEDTKLFYTITLMVINRFMTRTFSNEPEAA